MEARPNDLIARNSIFAWLAVATVAVLIVPLVAMQFTGEMAWTAGDFIVAGALIFGASSLFVLAARARPRQRVALAVLFGAAFLWLWAELAVGVFTRWGS
jgi:ABC-type transport system involved in multi-copper enzyme maturation permease subunit